MSTAVEHGLADPKRRGKPVSLANQGWRVRKKTLKKLFDGRDRLG